MEWRRKYALMKYNTRFQQYKMNSYVRKDIRTFATPGMYNESLRTCDTSKPSITPIELKSVNEDQITHEIYAQDGIIEYVVVIQGNEHTVTSKVNKYQLKTIKAVKDVPSVTGVFEVINNRTVLVGYIKY